MNTQTIFLCGHRKSGTTLLLDLLDGHPDLCVFPTDANYLYAYFPSFVRDDRSLAERRARFDRVVFDELARWLEAPEITASLDVTRFQSLFHQEVGEGMADIGAITLAFGSAYRTVTGRETLPFVLKETSIEIYAAELLGGVPNAKFIHLVRDPRDNYAALKAGVASYYSKLGENENETLASLIHRAKLGLRYARINQSIIGAERYLVIRLEDLLADFEKVAKQLCAFLDVPFSESLRHPTKLGKPTSGNNFEGIDFSALSSRNVGRWPERISANEAAVIEFHFGDLMDAFGYQAASSPEAQARAAAEFYKWQNYKYFYSDRFSPK